MTHGEDVVCGTTAPTVPDERFFRRLCEALGFIQIAVDSDLRVCFWNAQAERQFGLSAEAMRGRPLADVLEPPHREAVQALLAAAAQQGRGGEMEFKQTGKDEEPRTLVLIASPILDEAGRPIGASASMRDISQRRRLSQQLAMSRRMNALGTMAGGVVHHFNNLLGGMMTSIDSVLSSDSPRELRRTLRIVQQSMGRITRIIQQLEAFSKSEHESIEWQALNPLMERFIASLALRTEAAGIRLETDIADVPSRPFEAQRLIPVLDALAQNAIDAMMTGGTLTLRMSRQGDEAVIVVADTGCGIPEENLDSIFDPFFTTKGELADGSAGNTGLGLAAVHGLVGEMGGTIRVRSKVGEGTRMEIRLPLVAKPAADGEQLEPPAAS